MSVGWVAGAVRARAITRRRLGRAASRSLAASSDLGTAVASLSTGPYGRYVRPGQTVVQAQRAVATTLLWHGRVLAGWLPREGAQAVRVLAGWFEIANVDALLAAFSTGVEVPPPYVLGSLATAWPRLAGSGDRTELRRRLAMTPWGDPGREDDRSISFVMRLAWAARVRTGVSGAHEWAAGAAALLLARELVQGHALDVPPALVSRAVGRDITSATTLDELAGRLPTRAAWAVRTARTLGDLDAAETAWWTHLESQADARSRSVGSGQLQITAALALLAADAWRVRAALALAARGGAPLEAFDALA